MDLTRILLSAALLLGLAITAHGQPLPVVPGEPALAPKAAVEARLRLPAGAVAGPHYRLPAVPGEQLEDLRARNQRGRQKRLAIGVTRPLPGGDRPVSWAPVEGGIAARMALTSPDAGSLRLAIDISGLPLQAQMVFFGSAEPGRIEGPVRVGEIADRSQPYWSPITEGDTQSVEVFVPGRAPGAAPAVRLALASHLFTTPSSHFAKRTQDIGDAGSCNVDVPCSALAGNAAFRNAAAATAQMVIIDGTATFLCTGTLLNDTDPASQQPWFYGANHCLDNTEAPFKTRSQMQSVANTLQTLWFFEASACRSLTANPGWVQVSGGATIQYQNPDDDVLFMRLNRAAPAGAFFAGWDPNPVLVGSPVVTIHHPSGDLKKVSEGTIHGYSPLTVGNNESSFIETQWTSGTTEPGSSGAGFFTWSGLEYLLRGGEFGGYASCTNLAGADYFSRLDAVYPSLKAYLAPSATPFADVTDLWWGGAAEDGWGLNLIQHASTMVFGVWYTYGLDGKRTWFVLPAGTWTDSHTYTGTLYATSGPAADGAFNPALVKVTAVGSATLRFADAANGTFAWTVNGSSGTKAITRQPF